MASSSCTLAAKSRKRYTPGDHAGIATSTVVERMPLICISTEYRCETGFFAETVFSIEGLEPKPVWAERRRVEQRGELSCRRPLYERFGFSQNLSLLRIGCVGNSVIQWEPFYAVHLFIVLRDVSACGTEEIKCHDFKNLYCRLFPP